VILPLPETTGEIIVVNETRSAPYRTSDYLDTQEAVLAYLNAALEDGDERVLLKALHNIATQRGGISQLARDTGLARETLYRALSEEGNPRYSSLIAILGAMGLELSVRPRRNAA